MIDAHRMNEVQDVARFILGGKAYFTLRSTKTGTRYTYRVKASQDGGVYFVGVMTGTDNTNHYSYIGTIKRSALGPVFKTTSRSTMAADAPQVVALKWSLDMVNRDILPATLEFWHEGRCACCGRRLTVPESINNGIGPECIKRYGRG